MEARGGSLNLAYEAVWAEFLQVLYALAGVTCREHDLRRCEHGR